MKERTKDILLTYYTVLTIFMSILHFSTTARAEFDPGSLIGRILHIAGQRVEIKSIASVGDHDFQVLVHVQ